MTTFGSSIPASESCVLRDALDRWADERPDKIFAVFTDGQEWSYAAFRERVRRIAANLQVLGVRQDDRVLIWLPNGPECVLLCTAVNYLGAVCAPINVAYRGQLLEHVIANAEARLMIAHGDLVPRLEEVALAAIETLVCFGQPAGAALAARLARVEPFAILERPADGPAPPARAIQPWDTLGILFTSGTTGPSKGVLCSYVHAVSSIGPLPWPCCDGEDRFLMNLPMFHIGGLFVMHAFLCAGASIAVVEGFSTHSFWDEIRRMKATSVFLLGAMASFLMKQAPDPRDREHGLRSVFIVPFSGPALGFHERFGVDTYTIFNMTEISTPLFCGPNPSKPAVAGRPRAGVEVRIVDENDCEVPRGTVGELMLRTATPWAMNHGYNKDPEATARAWRNGWFHTGDGFRIDEDGDYIYVDRLKDVIRRRGENISSIEVEVAMLSYPGVLEVAAIPVPSEHGEDEVLAVLALQPGHNAFQPAEFIQFLTGKLAHFMVPRYVRLMDTLPKTPTSKVRKSVLKEEGLTADCWDREAEGIVLRRERLSRSS